MRPDEAAGQPLLTRPGRPAPPAQPIPARPRPSPLGGLEPVPDAAAGQAGVFTAAQAMAEGWSRRRITRRVDGGLWVVVAGRALARAQQPLPPLAYAWAAHLTCPTATVSHLTAAAAYGFPVGMGAPVHVVAPGPVRSRDVIVHRAPVPLGEVRLVRGWPPMTSRRLTALDCLAWLGPDEGMDLWAWVSTRGVLTAGELGAAATERFARKGTPALLRILRVASGGAASVAERRLHGLLHAAGLTGWTANATVPDARGRILAVADVLFEGEGVVVEVDGWRAHGGREAFVADRRRQNLLVSAGYTILRFTWEDLSQRPAAVVAEIRRALSREDRRFRGANDH